MLSHEEMRRIEREEVEAARALQEQRERERRGRALHAYRQEVRTSLRRRPSPWWLLPLIGGAVGLAMALALRSPAPPDDTSGGISNSALMERCRQEVGARLGPGELRFPGARQAAGQFSAGVEGKRWDGWAQVPGGPRTEFGCSFTPADGSVHVELFQEDIP